MAMRWLPLSVSRVVAEAVASLAFYLTPQRRSVAERNLTVAMPEIGPHRRKEIIRGVYSNLGRVVLALSRMPRLNPGNIENWIQYEGYEYFEQALQRGKGALFMTAHLGNWELSAFAHAVYGHPMYVMVRPLDNPLLDRQIDDIRTACGNRTIHKQEFGRTLIQALRKNEAVGILVDQNVTGEDRVFVQFFGVPASATSGFAKIAMRTGATVIPGFALWKPELRRYVLKFYPPLEMVSTGDEERDIQTNTQACQSLLEKVIREHPEQWLWIHQRWKARPPGEPPFYA